MNTKIINVPKGIKYLGDWKDFDLEDYPYILDKQLPGCGFTEWCIRNKTKNIVLCSPRKVLLQNKKNQHPDEVYLVINKLEKDLSIDKDLEHPKPVKKKENLINDETRRETLLEIKRNLKTYINKCCSNQHPIKILVTYDSFRHVKDVLNEYGFIDTFYIIIDEFQSIFTDSSFKSTTELEFVDQLQDLTKVCYASATPMLEKYLDQLNEFKDLPYHQLDWGTLDGFRVKRPDLKIRSFSSINKLAKSIIDPYLKGEYEIASVLKEDGTVERIESKEAVFYVNSVKNIIGIIKNCGLTPDQVNILCAKTEINEKRVKTLGKGFSIGDVPLENEPNKMFTFCTRTVYLGADFYSTCARTFIVSDANMKTLKVDIDLDLPQILGRQRLDENPWRNRAEFYYKAVNNYKKKTQEDFTREVKSKVDRTGKLIKAYDNSEDNGVKLELAKTYKKLAETFNYSDDYIAINEHKGSMPVPVENELVKYSEIRAFEIQQLDYADRVSVINRVDTSLCPDYNIEKFNSFFEKYKKLTVIADKLKLIVGENFNPVELSYVLNQVELVISNYFIELGAEKIRALSYNVSDLNKECNIKRFDKKALDDAIFSNFEIGKKFSLSTIKSKLESIYKNLDYKSTPKANDLENYFEIKTCKFVELQKDGTKKSVNGYKLIKKLK